MDRTWAFPRFNDDPHNPICPACRDLRHRECEADGARRGDRPLRWCSCSWGDCLRRLTGADEGAQ